MSVLFSLYAILYATAIFHCVQLSIAGNNETDLSALLQIKAKITNDPLNVTSSWNDSLHFCEWHGVTCGHRHQRVVALDLSSSKLTGSISPFIGNLSFLRELSLHDNNFLGTIPSEIGFLQRLQYLKLLNNSLTGEIPLSLSNCARLIELNLKNNKLVGVIPSELGFLLNLQYLSFSKNKLTGYIPSSLGNLTSLTFLVLRENNLIGEIPNGLGKLKGLTTISLAVNKLSGIVPPSIFNLSLLTDLDLTQNLLEGSLPSNLGTMLPNLQFFSIAANQLTGSIPVTISNSSNIVEIQLASNNLCGQVPFLWNLPRLYWLSLGTNFLGTGQASDLNFVTSLANATMLQWFGIENNNFRGTFPRILCNFSRLTWVTMWGNKINGQIPICIKDLVNLRVFEAAINQLSGAIPSTIGNLHSLEYLDVEKNQLSGYIPPSIGNLTKLAELYLDRNNLEGPIPSTIENCRFLTNLSLSENSLSGKIPPQLFSLASLSISLNLSKNNLIGSLAKEVGQLVFLEYLDISENKLAGEIPSTLSACIELEFLYMRGNNFQGSIPLSLAALKNLQEVDLSRNDLSGKIPYFLGSFVQLDMLNLSYNNLDGEVPVGGIFSNATGFSVFGNRRLCGGIPELKLKHCTFSKTQKRKLSRKMRLVLAILFALLGVTLLAAFVLLSIFCYEKRRKKPTSGDSKHLLSNLSYQSLLNATNGFSSENLIGSGTFGVVYKGNLNQDGTIIAVKKFNLEQKGASKSFMAECSALRNIRHRNLVKVITACSGIDYQGNDFKALVYQYMVNGSLEDWLHPERTSYPSRQLNFLQRLDIAIDVAFALEYLHHHCGGALIVHCDLKPSNVLLDDEMVAHVGDFGLAKFISEGISTPHANQSSSIGVRGTIGYAPPEYGLGNEVSTYGDVYSFGILILEMFTRKRPTDDKFKKGLSLHNFVKAALPQQVIEIIDPALLKDIVGDQETNSTSAHHLSKEGYNSMILEAVISILVTALSCSTEIPQERPVMSDVVAKLSSVRNKLSQTLPQRRRYHI